MLPGGFEYAFASCSDCLLLHHLPLPLHLSVSLSPPLLGLLVLGVFSLLCGIEECRMVLLNCMVLIACAGLPFVASQRSGSLQRPSSILSFAYL